MRKVKKKFENRRKGGRERKKKIVGRYARWISLLSVSVAISVGPSDFCGLQAFVFLGGSRHVLTS
jgi:hypothetical protein